MVVASAIGGVGARTSLAVVERVFLQSRGHRAGFASVAAQYASRCQSGRAGVQQLPAWIHTAQLPGNDVQDLLDETGPLHRVSVSNRTVYWVIGVTRCLQVSGLSAGQ